jgi:hypothetical protein
MSAPRRRPRAELTAIRRDASGNRRSVIVEERVVRRRPRPRKAPARDGRRRTGARAPAWSRRGVDRSRPVPAARRALRVAPPPQRRIWPWVLVGLVLCVLLGRALRPAEPDPHFLRAQQILEEHELGKPQEHLNYGDRVYIEVLDELRRVAPDSISAEPARELSDELGRAVDAFRAERQAGRSREDALAAAERERARELRTAQALGLGLEHHDD